MARITADRKQFEIILALDLHDSIRHGAEVAVPVWTTGGGETNGAL